MFSVGLYSINTSHRRQSKTIILLTNVDLRSLEIEFLIAVCRQTVNFFLVALVSDCFCYIFSRPILNKHFRERQSKMSNISTNVDPGSLETELLPAVCHPTSDKWQSKTQFPAICDPRSSIIERVLDCRLSDMIKESILC